MVIIIIIIITTIKRSQQSIYIHIFSLCTVYFVLGHNTDVNDVNTQQNEAYNVIGQFRVNMFENMSYGNITTLRLPMKQ